MWPTCPSVWPAGSASRLRDHEPVRRRVPTERSPPATVVPDACRSTRRPGGHGGPNGGDGGRGGDIWLVADRNVASLLASATTPIATPGVVCTEGEGSSRTPWRISRGHGARGHGRARHVLGGNPRRSGQPSATDGSPLTEVVEVGGNARFLTNRRRAPSFAEQGEHGEERWLKLELKLLADVAWSDFQRWQEHLHQRDISRQTQDRRLSLHHARTQSRVVRFDDGAEFVVADIPASSKVQPKGADSDIAS